MLADLASLIYFGLDSVFDWVRTIYRSFGISIVGIFFALVFITALSRYILKPFIGSKPSDQAILRKAR